jgi:GTP diphosphokinase / guanosine-3',5'-bis(diphosphate) 3'-diphosphatase
MSFDLLKKINSKDLGIASKELWEAFNPHISSFSKKDRQVIELAFEQMVVAHNDQRRKSGVFYIIHPVSAAIILCKIGLDVDTIAACLLHDVPEDTDVSLKDLAKEFSPEIVFLVEGVTKLSSIKYRGEDRYTENLRKMFVAMSKDLRVIFIKLADRLHNLRTLEFVKPEKRQRIALESLEIYAPIAERLGISYFRSEIEEAAFPYIYPDEYKKMVSQSDVLLQKRTKNVEIIRKNVENIFKKNNIHYEKVIGRAKKYYSIYRKIQKDKKLINQIYDLVALRVVTYNIDNCYQILATLHNHFEPVDGRIKDYISKPKENGYQSIHTTVKDPKTGVVFEFQIRTKKMQNYAEFGVAAHWSYKDNLEADQEFLKTENMKWISELVDLGRQKITQEQYLKRVKLDLFADRIFVMTPKNDAISLPEGASALDFAYKIHMEVGQHATMAKINGEIAKLNTKLKSGDIVEIITDKKQTPKRDWIYWVNTEAAIKHIRNCIKKLYKKEGDQKDNKAKKN